MPPRSRAGESFVERHGLWSPEQTRRAAAVAREIKQRKLETVRFSFADQHGVLRGKTLLAEDAIGALRSGVSMTTTLLAKDTSHRSVFPVFTAGGGFGMPEMEGGADFVMVADPATFRVLPWAPTTGWVLCDIVFANGKPVPFSTRQVLRDATKKLAADGYDLTAGLEVEFHLFKIENPRLAPEDATWPPAPPDVSLLTPGYQYLTETRYDMIEPVLDLLRRNVVALGLPLRSMEIELGPSQCEFTFRPGDALASADAMILFRAAVKQVARRNGLLASFMCRPALPHVMSSGWHLHQSLIARKGGRNAFASDGKTPLSMLGMHYLGGLLTHAAASAAFSTPTINGYKRYRPYSLAPDRAIWGRDNRGVMIRVLGQPGDASTHLENRIGEPAANPYLYLASQIHAGRDGIANRRDPGPSADTPYETQAPLLPTSLGDALAALTASDCLRAGFGAGFVDYFVRLKEGELARYQKEETHSPEATAWEQREYFDLF
ncbi:MAG: glutamine synthetase family protein [Pseudolabrys sp.]